ncbi:MAG: threonine--tRNA ligase [Candidatus Uhrbacteria bacterium]|nr:threonine--tRNA ligase [Patescibacteria group bacterium]MBU1907072.1 threonine--tRNA ligase [Patescibacteria group bacterium]
MNDDKLEIMRHSAAHLLAAAVAEFYPGAKFGVGPVIENGFYYDIKTETPISEDDLAAIEKKMKHMIKQNISFEREEMGIDEAIAKFEELAQPYKVELLKDLKEKGTTKISEEESQDVGESVDQVSIYTTGKFVDLCRGPHVESSKDIKVIKLTRVAGAYWRGDEKNPMLTRVYGTAFETQEELDKYLEMLEEAKRRDHRKIGKEQELFMFDELVGKGLPLWLPKGTMIRNIIEEAVIAKEDAAGYVRVVSPHMGKKELYETSGHLPYYADSMYPPMEMDDGTYYLKAMNCPHHHLMFRSKIRSYRDMPIRVAEYGTCFRNELSGTLAGLLRVRELTMNDAHIYCTKDQIKDEIKGVLNLTIDLFKMFGFENYWFRLSKWDPARKNKYIDEPENWEYAEAMIKEVLEEMGVKYKEEMDEAAFYGPKVDGQFTTVVGREESLSTVQLDFAAKSRFGLNYVDRDGKENGEVFVIHRAPVSTHERLMAFLIEHYAGAWPMWLAPVQVRLLSVGEAHIEFAHKLEAELKAAGVRVEVDDGDDTVGNKIRKAAGEKIPWTIVLGDKEVGGEPFKVRVFGQKLELELKRAELIEQIKEESKI